jgi:hypothetical protein
MVEAGESEFCPRPKARNLLISLNAKNAKNNPLAQVRYTAGTRNIPRNDLGAGLGEPTLHPVGRGMIGSFSMLDNGVVGQGEIELGSTSYRFLSHKSVKRSTVACPCPA